MSLHRSMRFSRRAFLGTAATLAAAQVLAACASAPATNPPATTPATGNAQPAAPQSAQLQFMLLGPSNELLDAFNQKIIPAFNQKQPGVKIDLQTSDWGSAFQKITTAAAAGTLPDTLTVGGIWTAPLAGKGALRAIDEYTNKWPDKAQFYEGVWKDAQYKGQTYCVPYNSDTRTVVYRSDFFQDAGLDPAKPPTTWDEYKAAAAKLVKKDGGQVVREGANWGIDTSIGLQQAYAQILFQAGGTYYTPDGKPNFSSPEGLKALNWLVSFFKDGLSSVHFVNQPNAPSSLVAGTGAMTYANYGVITNAQSMNKEVVPKLKAALPLKMDASSKPVTSSWNNKYGIGKTTKAPDAGWAWVAHLTSAEWAALQLSIIGQMPARKDLANADFMKGRDPVFIEAANDVVPQPPNPEMLQIVQIINKALDAAIHLQATPEQTLKDIDAKVSEVINV